MIYTNPILRGDYSDPDVVRVGEDYYMISSSFTYLPGIPVLHSRDLVHWEQIGNAVASLPFERYDKPQHKCGTWAPSIRFHNGMFYVYVCLPDEGLCCFTAKDPAGDWEFHYVQDVCGWIDPCPLFDDDGSTYLVHAFAGSRAGIKNILYLHKMSSDGFSVMDCGRMIYDGSDHGDTTVEGPKFYKRDGFYYIMCPAGGVKPGYQLALRSGNIYGPYERKVVLAQGSTDINGPHQGGWVDTGRGQDWFIHFRDVDEYGRIPYLEPVTWKDGWPEMGVNNEPVHEYEAPDTGCVSPMGLQMSDEFDGDLRPEWQWQANPAGARVMMLHPGLRLYAEKAATPFDAVNFLSKLMQAFDFTMVTRVTVSGSARAGICMMGYGFTHLALENGRAVLYEGTGVDHGRRLTATSSENAVCELRLDTSAAILSMRVHGGKCAFSVNGTPIGGEYALTPGGWTGARPGIYCIGDNGHADFSYVRFTDDSRSRMI